MKNDYLKEKLTWLRLWLTFSITIDAGCIAWFVSNYHKTIREFLYSDILVVLTFTILIIFFNQRIRKTIKIMRDDFNEQ